MSLRASGRVSAALARGGEREAAVGLSLKPAQIPVELIAERRIALRGGRNAFALVAAGGFSDEPLGYGLIARGYGQAGIIGLNKRDLVVDGAVSVARPLGGTGGGAAELGAFISGGAQPGLSRLDAGPELSVLIPTHEQRSRVTLQWRFRVAGNARPQSGPAVTFGADF